MRFIHLRVPASAFESWTAEKRSAFALACHISERVNLDRRYVLASMGDARHEPPLDLGTLIQTNHALAQAGSRVREAMTTIRQAIFQRPAVWLSARRRMPSEHVEPYEALQRTWRSGTHWSARIRNRFVFHIEADEWRDVDLGLTGEWFEIIVGEHGMNMYSTIEWNAMSRMFETQELAEPAVKLQQMCDDVIAATGTVVRFCDSFVTTMLAECDRATFEETETLLDSAVNADDLRLPYFVRFDVTGERP